MRKHIIVSLMAGTIVFAGASYTTAAASYSYDPQNVRAESAGKIHHERYKRVRRSPSERRRVANAYPIRRVPPGHRNLFNQQLQGQFSQ
jgi:hypothetical protein